MAIQITKQHITIGKKKSLDLCPVALAIRDDIPGDYRLIVHCFSVTIGDDHFTLPHNARVFIEKFDVGSEVSPFEFELEYIGGLLNENP